MERSIKKLNNNDNNKDAQQQELVLFFVKVGTSLPQKRIDILAARAKEFGAIVVYDFEAPRPKKRKKNCGLWEQIRHQESQPPPQNNATVHNNDNATPQHRLPTHLVVSEDCTKERVAKALKFQSADTLQTFLLAHKIKCATPKWITDATKGELNPRLNLSEIWWGIDLSSSKRPASTGNSPSPKKQRALSSPPVVGMNELAQCDDEQDCDGEKRVFPSNQRLADALKEMGKLHQKCPLCKEDAWKSYCFDRSAGKIRNLNYEVTMDEECLKRLKEETFGIGNSTMKMIKEFLTNGFIKRAHEFKNDPERKAIKVLTGIHGIGFSKAKELYQQPHEITTIDELRRLAKRKPGYFERNQLIGIQCYEDFLEKMNRDEVEQITKIVEEVIRRKFPLSDKNKLEVTIMGSYRRGNEECGDVDILITHNDYADSIPSGVLGNVVEELLDKGYMAYHLTFISGMKNRKLHEEHLGGYNLRTDGPKEATYHKARSSYMGVFNSPVVQGKRRRVDIKFYPYRERGFASIYFTGNGFFNRSIRLYADRKKGYKLDDQGLTDRRTKERVMEAETEKDVFDFLGVEYIEPHERTCFDDLVLAGGGEVDLGEVSKAEFDRIEVGHDHYWKV